MKILFEMQDQYILHTAEAQNINLPFACRHGTIYILDPFQLIRISQSLLGLCLSHLHDERI